MRGSSVRLRSSAPGFFKIVVRRHKKQYTDAAQASRIYILPNSLTAGNLFFGFLAIIRCIQARYVMVNVHEAAVYYKQAVWCILLACVFDLLDGRVARMRQKESLFGKEFDSIADAVSFGVAPALMVFFFILSPTEGYPFFRQIGWLISFIYLLCAGIRLARFNVITHPLLPVETRMPQGKDFLGLPVPMAAGLISSLVLLLSSYDLSFFPFFPFFACFLPLLMLLVSWLMVSNIIYPSFKERAVHTHLSIPHFILFFAALPIFFWYYEISLTLLFLAYIFSGLFKKAWLRLRKKTTADDGNPPTPVG